MKTFSVLESLNFGLDTFKLQWKKLLPIFGLGFLIIYGFQYVPALLGAQQNLASNLLFSIVSMAVSLLIQIGIIHISLLAHDKKDFKIADLLYTKVLWKFFLMSLVMGLVVIGTLLPAIIGFGVLIGLMGNSQLIALAALFGLVSLCLVVFVTIRLQLASYLVVDQQNGPIASLNNSWQATKGNFWKLFLFSLSAGLINLAGVLALGIGLLATIPITSVAMANVYRKLTK
jgi:hypothetical protein